VKSKKLAGGVNLVCYRTDTITTTAGEKAIERLVKESNDRLW